MPKVQVRAYRLLSGRGARFGFDQNQLVPFPVPGDLPSVLTGMEHLSVSLKPPLAWRGGVAAVLPAIGAGLDYPACGVGCQTPPIDSPIPGRVDYSDAARHEHAADP